MGLKQEIRSGSDMGLKSLDSDPNSNLFIFKSNFKSVESQKIRYKL